MWIFVALTELLYFWEFSSFPHIENEPIARKTNDYSHRFIRLKNTRDTPHSFVEENEDRIQDEHKQMIHEKSK